MVNTKEEIEARAEAYIEERVASSGAPFPLIGIHRTLCAKLMAAFACREVADALRHITDDDVAA